MSDNEKIKQQIQELYERTYKIEVEVLEGGTMPMKAHKSDAGFDVYATDDITIKPGRVTKHPLNIKLKLPPGTYAEICTKSGLGSKGVLVYAGIVDQGYRGIPHVICTNVLSPDLEKNDDKMERLLIDYNSIEVKKGQKLAQFIIHPFSTQYYLERVEKVDIDTDRGTGGFGSSGA